MAEGTAPVMVVLFASDSFPEDYETLCRNTADYEVLCPPGGDQVDTAAEASQVAQLSRQYGWSRVMIVTSNYHLRRARYLDRKCSGEVAIIGAAARPRNLQIRLKAVAKEMVAMPIAIVEGCPPAPDTGG
ncbi:MAG: ElyC/SanA/YdcF family protein [Acidimicrobiales bacterium]